MLPEVSTYDIFSTGGTFILLLSVIGINMFGGIHIIDNKLTYVFKGDTKLRFKRFWLFLMIAISLPYLGGYLLGKYGIQYCSNNKVLEIKLKYREKVENLTNLLFVGKRDNFYVFLKENGELISYNKDEILMIDFKNNSK